MNWEIRQGNCLELLRAMPAKSVHCIVTSPPYWGLRDYKIEPQVWGGDPACRHRWEKETVSREMRRGVNLAKSKASTRGGGKKAAAVGHQEFERSACAKCGAWRGHYGLEPTPEIYLRNTLLIFRELHRVLRDDGTLWLNLGDSYAGGGHGGGGAFARDRVHLADKNDQAVWKSAARNGRTPIGLKPKDLVGMPWRVALALQAAGWYLRADIIWAKDNPMPESVTDRPTKAHEYIFLLAKRPQYFYDAVAVKEGVTGTAHARSAAAAEFPAQADRDENRRRPGVNPKALHSRNFKSGIGHRILWTQRNPMWDWKDAGNAN